ncbi:uncharacterized protein LOC134188954 [Corticium candelabrum]|uniref:uncharacterized protein LOC134188954 n=1 Tax=Corticium candelabrum TaxID=121492 RepID=UPI002E271F7E|nr:uncharacterized protein LOC134188954 [Corticium candelabrum]
MTLVCRLPVIQQIFLLLLVVVCTLYSGASAVSSQKRNYKRGFEREEPLYAVLKHTRSVSDVGTGAKSSRRGMCEKANLTTRNVRSLLLLVKNARVKSKRRVKSVESFRSIWESPEMVLKSVQTSVQKLKQILNSVERHQESEPLQTISSQFRTWHKAFLEVVQRLRNVDTRSADRWLQRVGLNFSNHIEAYDKIKMGICNFSNEDGETRDPKALTTVTNWFKLQMLELENNWKIDEELLSNVSKGALNLNSVTHRIAKTNAKLSNFRNQLEVTKVVNRWFRKMKYLLNRHSSHSKKLYQIIATNLRGNWVYALEKSAYGSFLSNLTANERRKLETIIQQLRRSVETLERATEDLQTSIDGSDRGSLSDNENGTRTAQAPSTLQLLDELIDDLTRSLREFAMKAKPIVNAESLSNRLLTILYEAMD